MGILTLAGVLGFVGIVFIAIRDAKQATAVALVFALSPGIWWELAARSTLVSNIALVLLFLLIVDHTSLQTPRQLLLYGAFGGLILSTRSVVIFPLVVYGSYRFLQRREFFEAIVFGAVMGLAFALTFLPFVLLWNPQELLRDNPLMFQMNRYLPTWTLPIFLIVSLFAGLTATHRRELYDRIGLVLFLTALGSLVFTIIQTGWQSAVLGSESDISYFLLALPFVLLAIPNSNADTHRVPVRFET